MNQIDPSADLDDLLKADRELTDQEMQRLRDLTDQEWSLVHQQLFARARTTYSVVPPEEFGHCVQLHMQTIDYMEMVNSDAFCCPVCGKLLKDRGTPVAAALLSERKRLAELYVQADGSTAGSIEATRRWNRLRAALGIPAAAITQQVNTESVALQAAQTS